MKTSNFGGKSIAGMMSADPVLALEMVLIQEAVTNAEGFQLLPAEVDANEAVKVRCGVRPSAAGSSTSRVWAHAHRPQQPDL
jgi:hypothetical protein